MAFTSEVVGVFLAVLDRGSFSAAARSLGRVPSAVSMTMAQLEAELGLALFDRSGREPRPTAAARALEPQARLLAGQLQQLNAHARSLTLGLEERLTLAIAPDLLSAPWAGPLATLAAEFPGLEVEVLAAPQADAMALLHSGRAQLALVFERPSIDGREGFEEVSTETLVAVMAPGHPALQESRRTGVSLNEHHLTTLRQIVVGSRDGASVDPRFVYARQIWRTDTPVAALALLEAGLGWGWMPRAFVRAQLAAGTLAEMPFDNLSNGVKLFVDVVWSKERPLGQGARRFLALMAALPDSPAEPGAPGAIATAQPSAG